MLAFVEFSPLLAFGVAYWLGGIYVATGVLMAAMVVTLLLAWRIKGKVSPVNLASTVLVLVLGGATLLLRNAHFLQWKPSVLMWLLAAVFLGSAFIGSEPLAQRMLKGALPDLKVTRPQWLQANTACVLFCLLTGLANIAIAYRAPEAAWIRFKVIGLPILTFVFLFGLAFWLNARATRIVEAAPDDGGEAR